MIKRIRIVITTILRTITIIRIRRRIPPGWILRGACRREFEELAVSVGVLERAFKKDSVGGLG